MMNNPQENQQAQCYQNHWWEVELVRKEQRIAELEQRIAELDLRLGCCRDASAGKDLLIAELEAQLPKVIEPKNGTCMCGNIVRGFDPVHYGWKNNYCPNCGVKLNWGDS